MMDRHAGAGVSVAGSRPERGGRVTIRKRLLIILAAVSQEWHEKTCAECGGTWMAIGPVRPELVDMCDQCESDALDRFMEKSEEMYQRMLKGVL